MNTLKYMGYEGTVEIDIDRDVCRGKILFIDDLVTYEAETPKMLKKEFELSVDDYLKTCQELGREPKKPCSGQFNVRTSPEIHKTAVLKAIMENISLNEVVNRALASYLDVGAVDINHKVSLTVKVESNNFKTMSALASFGEPIWEAANVVQH